MVSTMSDLTMAL